MVQYGSIGRPTIQGWKMASKQPRFLKQGSLAIAKMTARCALYISYSP